MSAEAAIRTSAETALAQAFSTARDRLPGDDAVAARRDAAFGVFAKFGLPSRRVEDWKYTDLRALMRDAKPLASAPDAARLARIKAEPRLLGDIQALTLTFVDGALAPALSDLDALEPGLSIRPLAEALADGDVTVAAHLGKLAPSEDVAVALNTALMGDGAVIRIASGALIERPLHLVFIASEAAASFARSLVVVEPDARVTLIESFSSAKGGAQINAAVELFVGDRAQVEHIKVIAEADDALHISTLAAGIGANAQFNSFAFAVGGGVVRNQNVIRFDGADTVAGIRGASLLKGRQHADTTLVATHRARGCQSREIFKTVLDGEAHGVFQGRIIVRREAQKTDARMMTQALLLSETAEADNKPELEIYADDVQCGHGATAGALDDELKFYLMARGIPAKEAESLLIQAFLGAAIDGVAHEGVREALSAAVADWLTARS